MAKSSKQIYEEAAETRRRSQELRDESREVIAQAQKSLHNVRRTHQALTGTAEQEA